MAIYASQHPGEHSRRRRDLIAYCVIVTMVAVTFGRVAYFDFVDWDDGAYVTGNPQVAAGLSWTGLQWAFSTRFYGLYQPLAWLSHMFDVSVWGLWAGGHHLTSVTIHAIASCFLYVLMCEAGLSWQRALAVALVFGLHPLRVESVAWVAERKDVLCIAFVLASAVAHVRWVKYGRPGQLVWGHLACALAILSKPLAVVIPLLLLLLDKWPLDRPQAWRRLILEKLGYWAMGVAMVGMMFDPAWVHTGGQDRDQFDLLTRISLASFSSWVLVAKFFWPVDLTFFYPVPWDSLNVKAAVGACFTLALLGVAAYCYRNRPWVSVGIAWYLAALLPSSGIVQISDYAYADRYSYLPSVGLAFLFVQFLSLTADRLKTSWRVRVGLVAGITLILAIGSAWQAGYWKNSLTLFSRAIELNPDNHFAQLKLSDYYFHRGELASAVRHAALAEDPRGGLRYQIQLKRHQGQLSFRQGDYVGAGRLWAQAYQIAPKDPFVQFHLGQLALAMGNSASAVQYLLAAGQKLQASSIVWELLAQALQMEGRSADAHQAWVNAIVTATSPAERNRLEKLKQSALAQVR